MLGVRLQVANKIGKKRWNHYHADSSVPTPFGVGVYRKRKGCECRQCSRTKQAVKHLSNKRERRYVSE